MGKKSKRKQKKTVKARRLSDLQPWENAFVSYGANDRPFAVVKEASIMKIDAKAFLEGLQALNAAGKVIKAGNLDEDAQKQVAANIAGAMNILAKSGVLETLDNKPVDPVKFQAKLDVIFGKMDQLAVSLQAVDLNLADYASALKEDMQTAVDESKAEMAPPPAAPTEEPPKVETPPAATTPPPVETKPPETPPAQQEPPKEEPPAATEPPKPETPPAAAAPETAPPTAAPPAQDPPEVQEPDADEPDEEKVTKTDLQDFGKTLVDQVMNRMKDTVEAVVQKSVSQLPATQPADGLDRGQPRQESAFSSALGFEALDFGSTQDLSKIKLPGEE